MPYLKKREPNITTTLSSVSVWAYSRYHIRIINSVSTEIFTGMKCAHFFYNIAWTGWSNSTWNARSNRSNKNVPAIIFPTWLIISVPGNGRKYQIKLYLICFAYFNRLAIKTIWTRKIWISISKQRGIGKKTEAPLEFRFITFHRWPFPCNRIFFDEEKKYVKLIGLVECCDRSRRSRGRVFFYVLECFIAISLSLSRYFFLGAVHWHRPSRRLFNLRPRPIHLTWNIFIQHARCTALILIGSMFFDNAKLE